MPTTTNYSWTTPTVGGSEDTWGDDLNALWSGLDTLLGGVNATEFAILDGATVSTAELNKLDGATITTAEINYLDGVTSAIQTQIDDKTETSDEPDLSDTTDGNAEKLAKRGVIAAAIYSASGIAKAWVNYTPSSATVGDSANVTSLVDNGTGDTTVNYTSSMSSGSYTQTVDGANTAVSSSNIVARPHSTPFVVAGSTRVSVGYTTTTLSFTPFDYPYAATTIHGDLA